MRRVGGRRGARVALGLLAAVVLAAPLVGVAVPDRVVIPSKMARAPDTPPPPAQFSHLLHGVYRCYACHPALFPQNPQAFSHADMAEGRFCGACHDGQEAVAVTTMRCEGCHVAR